MSLKQKVTVKVPASTANLQGLIPWVWLYLYMLGLK